MANFLKTKRGKNLLNMAYGLGASVVIIGAWMKLLHLPGANTALTAGLLTEAFIFALTAFDFPEAGYDWTLVYPELAGGDSLDDKRKKVKSASQQLDDMLSKAKMGPELIDSLQSGFHRLSDNVGQMADLSGATVSTEEYAANVQSASQNVGNLSQAASRAVEGVNGLYDNLSSSFGTLNSSAENMTQALANSAEDAARYTEEIGKLQKNLKALNGIYGGMLTAMNPGSNV